MTEIGAPVGSQTALGAILHDGGGVLGRFMKQRI